MMQASGALHKPGPFMQVAQEEPDEIEDLDVVTSVERGAEGVLEDVLPARVGRQQLRHRPARLYKHLLFALIWRYEHVRKWDDCVERG